MTETQEVEVLNEALKLVDAGLGVLQTRSMVPASEVTDMLLDIRLLLMSVEKPATPPATMGAV